MARRPFTDGAGFTRHCWECLRALKWQDGTAWCETRGIVVGRYDSPNNGSSVAGGCPYHESARVGHEKHSLAAFLAEND